MPPIDDYLRAVRRVHDGEPTEHSYRAALVDLLQCLRAGVVATNEPKHRRDCGAPDIKVADGPGPAALTIGYLECKDIGKPLDSDDYKEQLDRYRRNLPNLILTDYLEFRWYVEGEERDRARIGHVDASGRIVRDTEGARVAEKLLNAFLASPPAAVASPEELARHMARLTSMIRDIMIGAFAREEVSDTTRGLLDAFRETLLPDIAEETFANIFAQTLAYGLFAARANHQGPQPFQRIGAAHEIPKTNPFLRRLFETIAGTALDDEPFVGFVDDLTRLLANADMGAILADFGARTRREDPIVHFYETFLAAYDPGERQRRGVYYTPEPVVSYIVRSVDWILKEHFGLPDGLADQSTVTYEAQLPNGETESRTAPKVLILDPACGTGTFLYHVIDHIRQRFVETNNAGMWPGFVTNQLLPRLFGFELLMAPYAVAHLKLGMQLAAQDMAPEQRERWACELADDRRLGVYLTNTLEEAEQVAQMQFGIMQTIVEEANAASEVKRDMPIMVVLGNPPYSGHSANKGPWIDGLLKGRLPDGTPTESYYEVDGQPLGERKLWLQDDYVKFIRWAQWRIEQTGAGILAFITNHGYLDNPTFRGMRESLLNAFTDIYILNLHGNSLRNETTPDGSPDENVFDIRQGVAIALLVKKTPATAGRTTVRYLDLWGRRLDKYTALERWNASSAPWTELNPTPPFFPLATSDAGLSSEWLPSRELHTIVSQSVIGVQTSRDALTYAFTKDELHARMRAFAEPHTDVAALKREFSLRDTYFWQIDTARRQVAAYDDLAEAVQKCLYRPFDRRPLFYADAVVHRRRFPIMGHLLKPNLALTVGRAGIAVEQAAWRLVFCSDCLVDLNCFYRGGAQVFPLYLYPSPDDPLEGSDSPWPPGEGGRRPNLSKTFVDQFAAKLGLEFIPDGQGDLQRTFGPEDILHYIYAIFHSPTYRERYAEFLKIDFPRVPLTSDAALFRDLAGLGGELVALHLMESPALDEGLPSYPVPGDNAVDKGHPKYFAPGETPPGEAGPVSRGRVYINRTKRKSSDAPAQYFEGVPPQVWEFQVGGYQVLDKWLKDRRGRKLTFEDIGHYQRVVVALARTRDIMGRIDARIGDWPLE